MTNRPLNRILIVDDEKFMRTTIKVVLRAVGRFTSEEAADGAAALDKLAEFRPDLVLCDVGMTPMGGLEFVEKLRSQTDPLHATPVIMLTADASESTIVNAARLQISGYLLKPVSPKQVAKLFHAIFDMTHHAV